MLIIIFWIFSTIRSYIDTKSEKKSGEMEPPTKQQKFDGNFNAQTISLVWLDDSIRNSENDIAALQELRTFDPNLKLFQTDTECENYIKSQSDQSRIVLIVNGRLGQQIVPRVRDLAQIIAIYVFCFNKEYHQTWAKEFAKVKDVVIHFNELRNKIQLNHFNTNSTEVNQSTDDNQPNSGIYEFDNRYIISDICFDYLSRMEATANEKDEFTTSYQTVFTGQPQALANLQVFQESYSPDRALLCLRKNPLFIRILENIFQSANTQKMYICRFLIRDIQKQFEQHKCTSSISVYRGQRVSDENLQELKNSKGKIIAMKSFFSTNPNRDVAMLFIADQNEQKRVLFEVEANPQIEGAKAFMKMSPVFDQIDDDEVLFMLGSLFKINEIRDDENGITIIKMTLCANENDNSIKSQLNITNEGNGLIEYAQLQYNLSEILKYPGVLHHVVGLLEKHLNEFSDDHPDRIRCYDLLGSVTFAMDDLDACLNWSLKSFEIKKKCLRPDDPQLAACYEYLACVYLHKGENTQALDLFKQILTIYKQIFGDDHLSLIQYYLRMIEIHEYEGKFTDVLLCYNQIFSIMLKHYPIDDLNLAPIYSNIGKTWASLFQYPLALGYYQTSLDIKLKHLPSSSDSTALTYKNIGFVYKDMKNIDQAKIHFEKAAAIYRELHSSTYEVVFEIEQILQNLSSSPQ